ncbi:MAG: hypothetical protein KDJ77_15195 [Rhodobiaceae bacterium]|nr:hypothetical protein [Rhodobiaceae bacterium]
MKPIIALILLALAVAVPASGTGHAQSTDPAVYPLELKGVTLKDIRRVVVYYADAKRGERIKFADRDGTIEAFSRQKDVVKIEIFLKSRKAPCTTEKRFFQFGNSDFVTC